MRRDLRKINLAHRQDEQESDSVYVYQSLHHTRSTGNSSTLRKNKSKLCKDKVKQVQTLVSQKPSSESFYSYLKEMNLSLDDLNNLKQALRILFQSIESEAKSYIVPDNQNRLISPYLNFQTADQEQSCCPLYINEDHIRNGLMNHNDGPDVQDSHSSRKEFFQLNNQDSSVQLTLSPSSSLFVTTTNGPGIPLTLLTNHNHIISAMTSNFSKYPEFNDSRTYNNWDEKSSTSRRKQKVILWEQENTLQQSQSNDPLFPQYSYKTKPLTHRCETLKNLTELENDNRLTFPMVKTIAPYIIIHTVPQQNASQQNDVECLRNVKKRSHQPKLREAFDGTTFNMKLMNASSQKCRSKSDTNGNCHSAVSPTFSNNISNTENRSNRMKKQKTRHFLCDFNSVLTDLSTGDII